MNPQSLLGQMFILPFVVACVARTVCSEEVFREAREFCKHKSETCSRFMARKLFYIPTCEYCFSHYVTAVVLYFTSFKLLYDGWLGYFVSFFTTVFIANIYVSIYARVRVSISAVKAETKKVVAVAESEIHRQEVLEHGS